MKKWFRLLIWMVVFLGSISVLIQFKRFLTCYDEIEDKELESDALFYSGSPTAIENSFLFLQTRNSKKRD